MLGRLLSNRMLPVLARGAEAWRLGGAGERSFSSSAHGRSACGADISLLATRERCLGVKESLLRDKQGLLGEIGRQERLLVKLFDGLVSEERVEITAMRRRMDRGRERIRRKGEAKDAVVARLRSVLRFFTSVHQGGAFEDMKAAQETWTRNEVRGDEGPWGLQRGLGLERDGEKSLGEVLQPFAVSERGVTGETLKAERARLEREIGRLEDEFTAFRDVANEEICAIADEVALCERKIRRKEEEFMGTGRAADDAEDEDRLASAQEKGMGSAALGDLLRSNRERLAVIDGWLGDVDARMHALEVEKQRRAEGDLTDFPKRAFLLCINDEETVCADLVSLVKEHALRRKLAEIERLFSEWKASLGAYGEELDAHFDAVYSACVVVYEDTLGRFCGKTASLGFPKLGDPEASVEGFLAGFSGLRSGAVWDNEEIDEYRRIKYPAAASELLGLRSKMEEEGSLGRVGSTGRRALVERRSALESEIRSLRGMVEERMRSYGRWNGACEQEIMNLHRLISEKKRELKTVKQGVCFYSQEWGCFAEKAASVRRYRLLGWESDGFLGGLERLLVLLVEHMQERRGAQDGESLLMKDSGALQRAEECLAELRKIVASYRVKTAGLEEWDFN